MTTFTTKYTDEHGTKFTVTHEGNGPLFAAGSPQYEDDLSSATLHYGDPLDLALDELKGSIVTGVVPTRFEHAYYLLVRTGAAPNVHYYPVPIVMEQILKGVAPRWMRKRFTEIKKHLGLD